MTVLTYNITDFDDYTNMHSYLRLRKAPDLDSFHKVAKKTPSVLCLLSMLVNERADIWQAVRELVCDVWL